MDDYSGFEAIFVLYLLPALVIAVIAAAFLGGCVMVARSLASDARTLQLIGAALILLALGGAFIVYRWTMTDASPESGIYDPHRMIRRSYAQWRLRHNAIDLMRGPKPWEQPGKPDAPTPQDDGTAANGRG